MKTSRSVKFWPAVAAVICLSPAWQESASAGGMLNVRYSAVVTDVNDAYGVFGSVAPGDSIDGIIRYSLPAPPPDYADPTFATYTFPVTAGGSTLMTANLGSLSFQSIQNVIVQVYNTEDPNSPPDSLYGNDFQFIDGDTSHLRTTGLPSGFSLGSLGTDIGFFATDPSLIDFPNAPSTLLPLEQYDSYFTGGLLDVHIIDANGHLAGYAGIDFQLISLTSVPEPSSALLAGLALPLIVAWARRSRPVQKRLAPHPGAPG